jgi:hypothetical protein
MLCFFSGPVDEMRSQGNTMGHSGSESVGKGGKAAHGIAEDCAWSGRVCVIMGMGQGSNDQAYHSSFAYQKLQFDNRRELEFALIG